MPSAEEPRTASRLRRSLPPALWMGLLFGLSAIPGNEYPSAEGLPFADKLVHFGLYLPLGLLLARALTPRGPASRAALSLAVVIGLGFGISDELHQLFVPFRSCDVLDLVADLAGVTTGAAIWRRRLLRSERAPATPAA